MKSRPIEGRFLCAWASLSRPARTLPNPIRDIGLMGRSNYHYLQKGNENLCKKLGNHHVILRGNQKNIIRKSPKKGRCFKNAQKKHNFPCFFAIFQLKKSRGEIGRILHTYFDSTGAPCTGRGTVVIRIAEAET